MKSSKKARKAEASIHDKHSGPDEGMKQMRRDYLAAKASSGALGYRDFQIDTSRFPQGSVWSIYSRSDTSLPRVTITSPDYSQYIGREAPTAQQAMREAIAAYKKGERE